MVASLSALSRTRLCGLILAWIIRWTFAESNTAAKATVADSAGGQSDHHPLLPQVDEVVELPQYQDDADDMDQTDYSFAHPIFKRGLNIKDYLQHHILIRPKSIEMMRHQLHLGKAVIIPDAFHIDFAEAMHQELRQTNFSLYRGSDPDGFSFNHHNVYDKRNYSAFLNQTQRIFSSPETRDFFSEFTNLDCRGHPLAAPSDYRPGDYSNPHSDHQDQRTLSFVWHLTKTDEWDAAWGGALYWCQEHPEHAYLHATFNSLILFRATTHSQHFVTRVSHNVTPGAKRLAYNGWYDSTWNPQPDDDLEGWLRHEGQYITNFQFDEIKDILDSNPYEPERMRTLWNLLHSIYQERYPRAQVFVDIDANNLII
jgi:Rps23 Pro-64 3,4-dihydroxylase Tpa1-like proline 4-hydroxylase